MQPYDDDLTCQQVVSLLVDYLAGALAAPTAGALQEHLRDCPECVAFLRTYKATIQATRTLQGEDIPAELRHRVLRFLRRTITPLSSEG